MSRSHRRSPAPQAVPTVPQLTVARTAPPFLPSPDGGYALAHVVEWQRLPNSTVHITLAANDVHRHGYVVARTKILPPGDALVFLGAIDALTGDNHVLTTFSTERDAALERSAALEDAIHALHTQLVTVQARCARLEMERDTTARECTAAHRRAARLVHIIAEAGWSRARIARALGGDLASEADFVTQALATRPAHDWQDDNTSEHEQ